MNKEFLEKFIEGVLEDHEKSQINLASNSARRELAKNLATRLLGRYYVVAYASQESFE